MANEARNRLRSMGGIMASSPELMQAAAQRFQAGGLVPPVVGSPMGMSPVGGPMAAYNPDPTSRQNRSVMGALPNLGPVRPAGLPESPVFRGGRAGGPGLAREEDDVIAELMAQSGAFRGGRSGLAPQTRVLEEPPVDAARQGQDIEKSIATLQGGPQRTGVAQRISELESEQAQLDPEIKARATERAVAALADVVRPITDMGQDDKARATQRALDALAKRAPAADTGDGGPADPGTEPGKPEPKPKQRQSLRSAFRENLSLIKDIYGIDDEDQARDRMMNLAMMGLAIASGTSPNALTNIAQGMAIGAQGFAASAAQQREREQEMRQAALDLTLSERAAEDEFIRGQMEADQEFLRDLALAEAEKGDPKLYSDTASILKAPFGEFEVFKTTRQGFEAGLQDRFKAPDEIVAAYRREMAEKNRVGGNIARAQQLLKENPDQIAGIGGAFARTITSLGNAFGIETPNLTPSQEYDTLMTQLSTELAPIILGESGRTISDGDRARVAEALGFVVDKTSIGGDPGISVTGFAQTAVSDPEKLAFALETISNRLDEAYKPATDFMKKYFPEKLEQAPTGEAVEIDGYTVREVS